MEKKPSIIFMGTPEFAVPTLEAVHREFGVSAVVTVPDKPKGRGQKLMPSDVKEAALRLDLPVLQPESLKDPEFAGQIAAYEPDIIIVLAFRILPPQIYNIAKIGTFNIHGSLLPKYRGAAPINWAIINGEKKTGLTSFLLQEKVDTGDILLKSELDIPDGTTAGDLHDMLMPVAADLAIKTCRLLLDGNYTTQPQDSSQASPAPKLFRENCGIDWNQTAEKLRNFIHGVSPVPGAWTKWNSSTLKIYRTSPHEAIKGEPGSYVIENGHIYVQCADNALSLDEIQPEGKKPMKTSDFLRGYRGSDSGRFES